MFYYYMSFISPQFYSLGRVKIMQYGAVADIDVANK